MSRTNSDSQEMSVEGPDERLIRLMEVGVFNKRMELRSVAFGDERSNFPEGRALSENEMRWLIEGRTTR